MSPSRLPLVTAAFLVGILAAGQLSRILLIPWPGFAALAVAIGLAGMPRRAPWALALAAACVGAARLSAHEVQRRGADSLVRAAAADPDPRHIEGIVRAMGRRDEGRLSAEIVERDTGARLRLAIYATGEAVPELLPGDRIAAVGRLRPAVRYRLPASPMDGSPVAGHLSAAAGDVEVRKTGPPWHPRRHAARVQSRLVRWVEARNGPAEGKAVLRAALTGDRGGMPAGVRDALRDAGAAHVLAVSGLHLAAVAGLTFFGARRAAALVPGLSRRVRPALVAAAIAAPVAILYTFITGAQTSTVRALVMALAALAGAATDRRPRGPEALALAALAISFAAPHAVYQPAFQLSFAAAGALVFGGMPRARGRGFPGRALGSIRSLTRASVLTAAATAPFTALAFGHVAVAGVLTNLVAVPLTAMAVLPLGLVGAAGAIVWPAAGAAAAEIGIWVAAQVVRCSAALAVHLPPLPSPPPSPLELVALAALAAALWGVRRKGWPRRPAAIVALAALACVAGSAVAKPWLDARLGGGLRIDFLEVGQGDAAVVELPGGEVWLVDAGGEPSFAPDLERGERRRLASLPGERAVLEHLRRRRVRALDRVIVSHPHADHYAGLFAIAEVMPIRELWIARPHVDAPPPAPYRALVVALAARGTRVVYPRLDRAYRRGEVVTRVLAPRFLDGRATEDPVLGVNENSLVVSIDFAGRRVLFAGDVEREAEALLVDRDARALAADVVQVPHHGSDTSSTPALVDAVSPGWAIISCGLGNRYGMPSPAVVERWRASGARVVTTADMGSVTATVDRRGEVRVRVADP